MDISIGMIGASGAGKTSLMTAMFEDMRRHLAGNRDTHGTVEIQHADAQTKKAVAEAQRRFADCIRVGTFVAWERSARCEEFGFRVRFTKDGLERIFDFRIMDYPGGLLSNAEAFEKHCLPHIRKSSTIFVPLDAVALIEWSNAQKSKPELAAAILSKLAIDKCVSIVETWATTGSRRSGERWLYFVPVKTESFYADNLNCKTSREAEIEKAVRVLLADRLRPICSENGISMAMHPVDTYGCVVLDKAVWNPETTTLDETFNIAGGKTLLPKGAVDLFSTVLVRQVESLADGARKASEASETIIENRSALTRFWRKIVGDPEAEKLKKSKTAEDFYDDALKAMSRFSSSNRQKTF